MLENRTTHVEIQNWSARTRVARFLFIFQHSVPRYTIVLNWKVCAAETRRYPTAGQYLYTRLSTVLCSPTKRFCFRPSRTVVCRRVQNVRRTRATTQQHGVVLLILMYDRIRAGPVLYRAYRAIRFHSPSDRCFRHFPFGVFRPSTAFRGTFAPCPTRSSDLLPRGGVSREHSILNFSFCQLITVRQHSNKRKTPD